MQVRSYDRVYGKIKLEKCIYTSFTSFTHNGKIHRDDGKPAVLRTNGTKEWWVDGLRHNEYGPAVWMEDGQKFYYLKGKVLLKKVWKRIIRKTRNNEDNITVAI